MGRVELLPIKLKCFKNNNLETLVVATFFNYNQFWFKINYRYKEDTMKILIPMLFFFYSTFRFSDKGQEDAVFFFLVLLIIMKVISKCQEFFQSKSMMQKVN